MLLAMTAVSTIPVTMEILYVSAAPIRSSPRIMAGRIIHLLRNKVAEVEGVPPHCVRVKA
jgi:hypothetical protein